MEQKILNHTKLKDELEDVYIKHKAQSIMWVCTASFRKQDMYMEIKDSLCNHKVIEFSDFTPNPQYESVCVGVELFRKENVDFIIATGGGSALDVAKCIKLFAEMKEEKCYLEQTINGNSTPLLAVPTTAGTGSEATRFAVIYYKGQKQSVSHVSCIPEYVILEPKLLKSLPEYHKKATMFDSLCHAIESYWSIHSTEESRKYSKAAIELIMEYKDAYIMGDDEGHAKMLLAANIAGKAINITQTTAGHAMSYKLTSMYGIAHGHAVVLCVSVLWPFMLEHVYKCVDNRGTDYLKTVFDEIAEAMYCKSITEAINTLRDMIKKYKLEISSLEKKEELQILCDSVNVDRLKNNPVHLKKEDIKELYKQIFSME